MIEATISLKNEDATFAFPQIVYVMYGPMYGLYVTARPTSSRSRDWSLGALVAKGA